MSALGQKQTCAAHKPMSALPPIATAKANFRITQSNSFCPTESGGVHHSETFTHLSALSHDLIEVIMTTNACRLEVQFIAKGKRSLNLVMLFATIGKIKEHRRGTCQKQNVCR